MTALLCLFMMLTLENPDSAAYSVRLGRLDRIDAFPSKFVDPRPVHIWLPPGYSPKKKYDVVYMHDGQMLFDAAQTWNRLSWEIDESAAAVQADGQTRPFIVVGIWNNGGRRRSEYFPEAALAYVPEPLRSRVIEGDLAGAPRADAYLRFLVEEVKPYIERTYPVRKGPKHTFLAGSSMGGLISLYALSRFPEVFGAAACLSIHTIMLPILEDDPERNGILAAAYRTWLEKNLPKPNSRRIYIDHGDQTLDAHYAPYHRKLEQVFEAAGWKAPAFDSRFFPGTDHSETAWAARMPAVFIWLLGR